MVNYEKNIWNHYDESKTFSENVENNAVITLEKANRMEQGIYDANRLIEIGIVRVANEGEEASIKVTYSKDAVTMDFILPRTTITQNDTTAIIEAGKKVYEELFSKIYTGTEVTNPDQVNDDDIMLILSEDGKFITGIRTFTKNVTGDVTSTDLKFKIDISTLIEDSTHMFMTQEEKDKLAAIEPHANRYVHPTGDGNEHVPANGTQNKGKHLTATAVAGVYEWSNITKDEITNALGYTPTNPENLVKASSTNDGLMSKEHFVKLNGIEEGANRYIHPDSHPATMITQDEDHRFMTDDEKALLYYTNNTPTVVEHGGVAAGTTFNNKAIKDIIGDILYPYVSPSGSCSVITPSNGGTFEVGMETVISKVRVSVTKKSRDIKSIALYSTDNLSTAIQTKSDASIANGGTFDFNINKPINSPVTNLKMRAIITDADSKNITVESGAFNVVYPIYYGVADIGIEITNTFVPSLTKMVQTKGNKSVSYNANNQRMVFAYPKSYGVLTSIIDPNNFNVTDTFTRSEVNIYCADDNQIPYYVYVNEASTVSNFAMSFRF